MSRFFSVPNTRYMCLGLFCVDITQYQDRVLSKETHLGQHSWSQKTRQLYLFVLWYGPSWHTATWQRSKKRNGCMWKRLHSEKEARFKGQSCPFHSSPLLQELTCFLRPTLILSRTTAPSVTSSHPTRPRLKDPGTWMFDGQLSNNIQTIARRYGTSCSSVVFGEKWQGKKSLYTSSSDGVCSEHFTTKVEVRV